MLPAIDASSRWYVVLDAVADAVNPALALCALFLLERMLRTSRRAATVEK